MVKANALDDGTYTKGLLFNSSFESGLRSLVMLEASYPDKFDLDHMIAFDHFIVHTGDIGGPESLHPNNPGRANELIVRRKIVEEGLILMISRGLVMIEASPKGFLYQAGEFSPTFVGSLKEQYATLLKERGAWLIKEYKDAGENAFKKKIKEHIDRWSLEIKSSESHIAEV